MDTMTKVYSNILAAWNTRDDRGASLVEYALLVALIAVICIAAVTLLGGNASAKLDETAVTIGA